MTHLPFIAGAYAITLVVICVFAANAWLRMRGARRRLAALDTRAPR